MTAIDASAREQFENELDKLVVRFCAPDDDMNDFDPDAITTRIGVLCDTLGIPRDRYPGTLGQYPEIAEG